MIRCKGRRQRRYCFGQIDWELAKTNWWVKFFKKVAGWLFDDCSIAPNEKKIKKIFLEVISNTRIFNINFFFNEVANGQTYRG